MGGCCCCSSKGIELNGTPAYYHCPKASAEHEFLSPHHGAAAMPSTLIPYDVDLGHPRTPSAVENTFNGNAEVHAQD